MAFSGLFDVMKAKIIKSFYNVLYQTKEINIEKKLFHKERGGSLMKVLILKDGNILCSGNSYFILDPKKFEIIKENEIEKNLKHFPKMIQLNTENSTTILFYNSFFNFGYTCLDEKYNFSKAVLTSLNGPVNGFGYAKIELLSNGKFVYLRKQYKNQEIKGGIHQIYILSINKITNNIQIEIMINTCKNIFCEIKSKNIYLVHLDNENYISLLNNENYAIKQKYKFSAEENMILLNDEKFLVQGESNGEIKIYNTDNFELVKTYVSNKINSFLDIFVFEEKIFFSIEYQPVDDISNYIIKKWKYDEEKNEIICYGYHNVNIFLEYILKLKNEKDLYLFIYPGSFEIIKINNI